jgi:hypothetical protein
MFVDLQEAFDTVVRWALWWKLGKKCVSAKFIEALRGMYSNIKISVKLEENRITQEFDSTKGLRQGCALSPYNMYIDGILSSRRRWSSGYSACHRTQGSRVQTRPRTVDFKGDKISSTPSFGWEVKPSVPCRRFTACERILRA